jgi:TonB family protein
MISRDRVDRVIGTVKLCVAIDGHVASAKMLQSTKYPDYDATILAAVQAWRYQPYTLDNKPVPVCSTVTFVYTIR